MADVELVIKIPKRTYDYIRRRCHIPNSDILYIRDAIIDGTLLPKRCRKKMTNAEKFEEVFGIKIDEYSADPCDIFDCNNIKECTNCELYHFWKDQYREKREK